MLLNLRVKNTDQKRSPSGFAYSFARPNRLIDCKTLDLYHRIVGSVYLWISNVMGRLYDGTGANCAHG